MISILLWPCFALCQIAKFRARPFGYSIGGQLSLNIYKTYVPFYVHLERNRKSTIWRKGNELEIYANLSQRLLFPRYLVVQFTVYPTASLSSFMETERYSDYQRFDLALNINLIRSIGAGDEEPYAFSLLMGNILFLAYEDSISQKLKQSGSALAGLLFSTGGHQIYNNIYLHDLWYQLELILTGNLKEHRKRKLAWNFRFGIKVHQNDFFNNEMTMAIERDHSDSRAHPWSLSKNSVFKLNTHIPFGSMNGKIALPRYLILVGKKLPITVMSRSIFATLSFGVRWERIRQFNHYLKEFEPFSSNQVTWLVQPNIEF